MSDPLHPTVASPPSERQPTSVTASGPRWLSVPVAFFFWFSTMSIVGGEVGMALMLAGLLIVRPPVVYTRRELTLMLLPFGILYASILLSAVVNPHPLANLQKALVYRLVLLPPILLLILPHVNVRRLLQVLCVAVTLMGLYGISQFLLAFQFLNGSSYVLVPFGPFHRASGTFNNGLTYSGYLLLVAPALAMLGLAERTPWRWFWLLGAICAVAGMFASLSRSATVGLAASVLLLLFRVRRWLGIAATLAAAAVIAVLVLGGPTLSARLEQSEMMRHSYLLQRFLLVMPSVDTSSLERVMIWESGLLGFRDRPAFGFGLGNHDPELGPYQHKVVEAHGLPNFQFYAGYGAPLHNIYLRALFDLGLVGLLCYLGLWGSVLLSIARGIRVARPDSGHDTMLLWGLAAGLLGSMAAGFFEDNFFDGEVQTIIVAQMALSLHLAWRVRQGGRNAEGGAL